MLIDDPVLECSLNELGENDTKDSNFQSSLADRCAIACNKKLKDISSEELRMLIGQLIGLKYIVPLALSLLEEDPLCNAGLYRGDLLAIVLKIPSDFWKNNPPLNNRLSEIRISIEEIYKTLSEEIIPGIVRINFR